MSHPSRASQGTELLSLCYTAASHSYWFHTEYCSHVSAAIPVYHSCSPGSPLITHISNSYLKHASLSPGFPAMVKNLPSVQEPQETWVWSLGREDPLEEGMGIPLQYSCWRIPWTEEPGGPQSIGLQRVKHDWSNLARMHAGNVFPPLFLKDQKYRDYFCRAHHHLLRTQHGPWCLLDESMNLRCYILSTKSLACYTLWLCICPVYAHVSNLGWFNLAESIIEVALCMAHYYSIAFPLLESWQAAPPWQMCLLWLSRHHKAYYQFY